MHVLDIAQIEMRPALFSGDELKYRMIGTKDAVASAVIEGADDRMLNDRVIAAVASGRCSFGEIDLTTLEPSKAMVS